MNRVRIKFCGMTNVEDAVTAAKLGVDAIGLIFYPDSPRFVSIERAREIVQALPPLMTKVGVFVNPNAAAVEQVLSAMRLDCLQFHGDESPADCQQYGLPYIKVLRVNKDITICSELKKYESSAGFLLDSFHPSLYGGTGVMADIGSLPKSWPKPWLLAGGLNPENVAAAILKYQPYGVDVVSGIEASKGCKDADKMKQFIENVNGLMSAKKGLP